MTVGGEGRLAVAVLAAGRGSRLGGETPKPLALLQGRPLVAHALDAALRSGLRPVFLVVGHRGEEVAAEAGPGVSVVPNPRWEGGLSTSLAAAIAAVAENHEIDGLAVGLADQPGLGPESYRRLASAHQQGAVVAVATYDGVRGHPVMLGRPVWEEALALEGDAGARSLLARPEVVEVPCDGTGAAADVDTPADLAALEALTNLGSFLRPR
ncbi:MAG: nucleotidyltransferase family protein [Acidimicrobiia bacterium]